MEFKQYTYSSLKKPEKRVEMLENKMSSLGSQSGNYGPFTEQARVITLSCAVDISDELDVFAAHVNFKVEDILDMMPTLGKLIK